MDSKDAYIKQLENTVKSLEQQVSNLTEMLILMRKDKFGSSSEKTSRNEVEGQLSLFNEAEIEARANTEEPIKKRVDGYYRKNPRTKREELIKDLPVREVLCDILKEDCYCIQCETALKAIGKETVREELEYIPAKLQIVRYVRLAYECSACKHTDTPYIEKALTPTSLMNHSLASPSSVANVMYQKYVNGMPLYRQEKDWENLGLALKRSTMANWVIRCSEDYLYPVIQHLRKKLIEREIIHCDETSIQVLKEKGKKPQSKSYMWLYRTGNDGKSPIILHDYKPSRSGDHASAYLEGFKGFLHSDGFVGYNKLQEVTRCGCWAHLRRKFVEAIPDNRAKGAPLTNAEIGRDYCNKLFETEKDLMELPINKRYTKRLEFEKPVLDAFWGWLGSLNVLNGSALAKAVNYAKNQRPYMENYLLDGRCSISNNLAENSIRPFVIGRNYVLD